MHRSVGVVGAVVASIAGLIVVSTLRTSGNGGDRIGRDSIVMLGDSITEEADWTGLLPDHPLANEGHPGFTTEQLIEVADRVAAADPAAVIVLTGTNDIRDRHPPTWTRERLERLIDRLEQSSNATVVLQTILPRADASEAVRQANAEIRALAARRELRLLDLYATFDDGNGALRPDETSDGLHLTVNGYLRWADALRPVLLELP